MELKSLKELALLYHLQVAAQDQGMALIATSDVVA
jgi:hypothetical protein